MVKKWLGPQWFALLLKLYGVAIEYNLNPICKRMSSAKKSEQVATLQATFKYYKNHLNEPHLTFAADSSLLDTMLSLFWAMTTLDAIGTGIQFFRIWRYRLGGSLTLSIRNGVNALCYCQPFSC